jgi:hypothetical protein
MTMAVLGLAHWEECELVAVEPGYLRHCDLQTTKYQYLLGRSSSSEIK